MDDLIREARRNAKNWADKPESAAMWNRFADEIERLTAAKEAWKGSARAYRIDRDHYHDQTVEQIVQIASLQARIEELEGVRQAAQVFLDAHDTGDDATTELELLDQSLADTGQEKNDE